MPVNPIPAGHHTVTPYLIVSGAAKLIEFLQQAFDAEELHRAEHTDGRIMHAEIRIGDSRVMLGEASGVYPAMPAGIYLYVPDADELYFQALAAGGVSIMEPADQFYGDRMGGIRDPAGNLWWIATHIEDVSPEEMSRRQAAFAKGKPSANSK